MILTAWILTAWLPVTWLNRVRCYRDSGISAPHPVNVCYKRVFERSFRMNAFLHNSQVKRRVRDRLDVSQDCWLAIPGKFLHLIIIFIQRVIHHVDIRYSYSEKMYKCGLWYWSFTSKKKRGGGLFQEECYPTNLFKSVPNGFVKFNNKLVMLFNKTVWWHNWGVKLKWDTDEMETGRDDKMRPDEMRLKDEMRLDDRRWT